MEAESGVNGVGDDDIGDIRLPAFINCLTKRGIDSRYPAREMFVAMWWLLSMIAPCVAAWFVTKLMNQGNFDQAYFLASLSGALLFPFVAAFLSWDYFGHVIDASAFYDLKPRCAGAFIGGLAFDAAKALRS
jgi:hypothetical protein